MLSPKRTKFRKQHKGRIHGPAKAGTSLNFGAYGLKALEPERLNAREIEAARRAITRHMKRVSARRAASIWRAVTRSGSSAFRPYWPKASVAPLVAVPWMRPLNALRNLVRMGCNMT